MRGSRRNRAPVWIVAAVCLLARVGTTPADGPPNILFILTDDQRPDAAGCYGNEVLRTPNLDRIAAEGARLDGYYVAAPLCAPSRASFLTGLYPHQHGVLDNRNEPQLPSHHRTVASFLSRAGYVTGFIGKSHLRGDPRDWGFAEAPVWYPGAQPSKYNPSLTVDGQKKTFRGHISAILVDQAVRWLLKHRRDRFFLWLATSAPHPPFVRVPGHEYGGQEIKPPPLWPDGQPLSNADWVAYYSTISKLDEELGRLFDFMRARAMLDRTVVIVVSDNGYMFGSHGYNYKGLWYEESARVPALVRWPARIKGGVTVPSLFSSVDLLPTLCEIAGVEPPDGIEGVSMLGALTGGKPGRTTAYAEVRTEETGHWQMIRDQRFKYVHQLDGRELLFDLDADPHETVDLTGRPEGREHLERLRARREAWLAATPPPSS